MLKNGASVEFCKLLIIHSPHIIVVQYCGLCECYLISILLIIIVIMESNNEFEYTGTGCVVPKDVTSVRFQPSVVEVEDWAFRNCKQLRVVMFNNEVVLNEGLQKIGLDAFHGCKSLESITLPSTVTEIERGAFYNCINLRKVIFNDGLKKIGRAAFYNCTSLSSIILPSTATEIGISAFEKCKHLREVVLNDGLQKIGHGAFYRCSSLSSITLPSTLNEIDHSAFRDCSNLREVILHSVPRAIGQYAFSNCTSLERFTLPTISNRLDALIQTGHWEEIENEVNEVRGVVERIGELFVSTRSLRGGRNWSAVRRDLNKISRLISYYELKEGTSMFELALWKFKLDQVDEANPIPRKKCRMDVPGPVKDIILQYLR